jgi:hypothetical protein
VEEPSGKPVAGAVVEFHPHLKNNPFLRHDIVTDWMGAVVSGADGAFQIAVHPGPAHLWISSATPDFIHREVGQNVFLDGSGGGRRCYPDGIVALDLKPDAEPPEVTVTLRRGVSVAGRLLRADDTPAARAQMLTRLNVAPGSGYREVFPVEVRAGHFALHGLDPEKTYPVLFLDAENQQGAIVQVSGKQAGGEPLTVRLAPCGSARVRFVDPAGKPLADYHPTVEAIVTPGPHWNDPRVWSRRLAADGYLLSNLDRKHYWFLHTDADGRCTLPALIPGAPYRIWDRVAGQFWMQKDFSVEAGKVLELPDLVVGKRRVP